MGGGNFLAGLSQGAGQSVQQARLQARRLRIQQEELDFKRKRAEEQVKDRELAVKRLQELAKGGQTTPASGPGPGTESRPPSGTAEVFSPFDEAGRQSAVFDAIGGFLGSGNPNAAQALLSRQLGPTPAQLQAQRQQEVENKRAEARLKRQEQLDQERREKDERDFQSAQRQFAQQQAIRERNVASTERRTRLQEERNQHIIAGNNVYRENPETGAIELVASGDLEGSEKARIKQITRQTERYSVLEHSNRTLGQLRDHVAANPDSTTFSAGLALFTQNLTDQFFVARSKGIETDGKKGQNLLRQLASADTTAGGRSNFEYLRSIAVFNLAVQLQGESGGKLSDKDIEAAEEALGKKYGGHRDFLTRLEKAIEGSEDEADAVFRSIGVRADTPIASRKGRVVLNPLPFQSTRRRLAQEGSSAASGDAPRPPSEPGSLTKEQINQARIQEQEDIAILRQACLSGNQTACQGLASLGIDVPNPAPAVPNTGF